MDGDIRAVVFLGDGREKQIRYRKVSHAGESHWRLLELKNGNFVSRTDITREVALAYAREWNWQGGL